jgi:hypothetical protein
MPVPPQESAPSLSPGQSFGCQSPLPWVTGTDWTGSLRVLWQLQGSFQELSPSSAHSLTWRESLTGQQASRSPELRHNKHRENGHRLPKNQFNSHRMFSRSRFQNRAPRTSSLSFSWANRDSSPKLTWTFHSGNAHTGFLSQTDFTTLNKGKHTFFNTQHKLPLCNRHTQGLLQTGSYRPA